MSGGRYDLTVRKILDTGIKESSLEKSSILVDVIGYLDEQSASNKVKPVEEKAESGDEPSSGIIQDTNDNKAIRLTSFQVADPSVRFLKIVSFTPSGNYEDVWDAHSVDENELAKESKSVHVLHKRKSTGRVQSFSEATSVILNRQKIVREDLGPGIGLQETGSTFFIPATFDSASNGIDGTGASPGKYKTVRIDLKELKIEEVLNIHIDTTMDTIDVANSGNEGKKSSVKVVTTCFDENGNSPVREQSDSISQIPELEKAAECKAEDAQTSSKANNDEEIDDSVKKPNQIEEDEEQSEESPVKMSITIANNLLIIVELDNHFESVNLKEASSSNETVEVSAQSLVETDTFFYIPFQEHFLEGFGSNRNTPPLTGRPSSPEVDTPERDQRKRLLRKLILNRLIQFGTPAVTAHDITDTWYSGYVQHRVLSYRVPKIRIVKNDGKTVSVTEGSRPNVTKPVQLKIGGKISGLPGFMDTFLYHANYLEGILNNATCTLLESIFYLMVPHFKFGGSSMAGPSGISPTFMKDWINVIEIAAFQLKPQEPALVYELVKRERKLLKRKFAEIQHVNGKFKEKIRYLQDKTILLRERTQQKVKLDADRIAELSETSYQPYSSPGYEHLQMTGISAREIFPNALHFITGKYGLFLKRELGDHWYPFSDLNFLEKRVLFLGLVDHLYSSLDAVLVTLRRTEELWIPGYPMNILTRFSPLFDLLRRPNQPFQLLALESKLIISKATYALVDAMKRFKTVFKELQSLTNQASIDVSLFEFSAITVAEYNAGLGTDQNKMKYNLTCPFPTLDLNGFANLTERGTHVEMDELPPPRRV